LQVAWHTLAEMSSRARIIIAILAILCGVGFAATAFSAPEAFPNPGAIYGCAVFCLLVAVACAGGPAGETVRRIIAGLVCLAYGWYIFKEVFAPNPVLLSGSRGKPDIVKSIVGFLLIGLPCGLYAILGNRLITWFRSLNSR